MDSSQVKEEIVVTAENAVNFSSDNGGEVTLKICESEAAEIGERSGIVLEISKDATIGQEMRTVNTVDHTVTKHSEQNGAFKASEVISGDMASEIVPQITESAVNAGNDSGNQPSEIELAVRKDETTKIIAQEMQTVNATVTEHSEQNGAFKASDVISGDMASEIVPQITESAVNAGNDSGNQPSEIKLAVRKDETNETIAGKIETAAAVEVKTSDINDIICADGAIEIISGEVANEIVPQIMKSADNPVNDSGNQPSEIELEVRKDETNETIAGEIETVAAVEVKESKLNERICADNAIEIVSGYATSENASQIIQSADETPSELKLNAFKDEAIEIVPQAIESAQKICEIQPPHEERIVPEMNEVLGTQSSSEFYCEKFDLEASFVVECIEKVKVDDDEKMKIVATIEDYPQTNELELVTAGRSDEMIQSTELISETFATGEKGDQQTVDRIPGSDEQNTIVIERGSEATGATKKLLPVTEPFYSDEELGRKGYTMETHSTMRWTMNLLVTADPSNISNVLFDGLPKGITENELIPLLESAGQVYRFNFPINMVGKAFVTYLTEKDALNAIKMLNGRKFGGRQISVTKSGVNNQLFVKPISRYATKREIYDQFRTISYGLIDVTLVTAPEEEGKNKGFCYLKYQDHAKAFKAKRIISTLKYKDRPVVCNWYDGESSATNLGMNVGTKATMKLAKDVAKNVRKTVTTNVGENAGKLFIANLHPDLRAADLREIFSVYGEVVEIDRSEDWATVKFRDPERSKVAAKNVNKRLLGGQNVEIIPYVDETKEKRFSRPEKKNSSFRKKKSSRVGSSNGNVETDRLRK